MVDIALYFFLTNSRSDVFLPLIRRRDKLLYLI